MRRHEVSGGDLTIFTALPDGTERPLFRHGQRRDEQTRTITPYAINYVYGPAGAYTEYESIEIYQLVENIRPQATKYVVREHPNLAVRLPLRVYPTSIGHDVMVDATLVVLGHTEAGGPEDNPREPWAHFQIDNPNSLDRAFGHLRGEGRKPNATGAYLELKNEPDSPAGGLIVPFATWVNGRTVTFARCGALTIDYGPGTPEGEPGPMLKATLRKIIWAEGDLNRRLGMMA